MSRSLSLTPRQQFWVEHLQCCAQRKQSLSSYAAEHGLAIGALYEAKSRLKRMGALSARVAAPRFVRVHAEISAPPPSMPALCRVLLPNGVTVETVGADLATVLFTAGRLS
jgi:hypothetical protein